MKVEFEKSPNKTKKYRALIFDGEGVKYVDFGAIGYEQYRDKIGLYSHLDHRDKTRRQNYRDRHGKIKLADGRIAKDVKYTSAWFSWNYLW